jgi:DNA-binding CsgD family transcriptional regulator
VYLDISAVAAWAMHEELAVEVAREGIALAQEHGFETYYGAAIAANGAESLLSLGRLREAAMLLDATEVIAVGGWSDTSRLITRAAVATALGDLERARTDMETTASWADTGDRTVGRWRAVNLAELTIEDGRPEDVAEVVRSGLDLPPTHVPWEDHRACLHWLDIRAQADLAQRAMAHRDRDGLAATAAGIAASLQALGRLFEPPTPERSPFVRRARAYEAMARAEATRACGMSDPEAWRAAARGWTGLNWVLRPLYARIREAEGHLEAGRAGRKQATEILRDAHREATARDAGPLRTLAEGLAGRARVDLSAAHAAPPLHPVESGSVDPAHLYGLTVREVEILVLVASGLTNRQIGDRLFISPKTAGVHVSNILGKFGVTSRIQAATVAHRLGMDPEVSELTGSR